MVAISLSGSGEGPGWVTAPGYSTAAFPVRPRSRNYVQWARAAPGGAIEDPEIARKILAGGNAAPRDIVVLNAAAALCAALHCDELGEAVAAAEASLDSGAARDVLERWVAFMAGGGG